MHPCSFTYARLRCYAVFNTTNYANLIYSCWWSQLGVPKTCLIIQFGHNLAWYVWSLYELNHVTEFTMNATMWLVVNADTQLLMYTQTAVVCAAKKRSSLPFVVTQISLQLYRKHCLVLPVMLAYFLRGWVCLKHAQNKTVKSQFAYPILKDVLGGPWGWSHMLYLVGVNLLWYVEPISCTKGGRQYLKVCSVLSMLGMFPLGGGVHSWIMTLHVGSRILSSQLKNVDLRLIIWQPLIRVCGHTESAEEFEISNVLNN